MTSTGQFERFQRCAAEVLSTSADKIVPEANLREDFGADSLDLVDLISALEREFEIDVDEGALAAVETVAQAFALVQQKA